MRDGVFQVLLKLFIGALDQQIRVMSLPTKGREVGQRQFQPRSTASRQARGSRTPVAQNPLQLFDRDSPPPDRRQRMPLPEAHGWVGADIEDDVENELRVAVE